MGSKTHMEDLMLRLDLKRAEEKVNETDLGPLKEELELKNKIIE